MSALGQFMGRRNIKQLTLGAIVTVLVYLLITPLTAWCREQTNLESGDRFNRASPELRLAILARGLDLWSRGALDTGAPAGRQGWWTRTCYTNAQTAVMHLYDAGDEGNTLVYTFYAWIPRFLWPDKPDVNLSLDFTERIQGHRGSGTDVGVFGDAYWNGGWSAVIIACIYVGLLFAWLSRTALRIWSRSEWLLLPCAFVGITMGQRLDRWLGPSYILGFLIYLGYYYVVRVITSSGQKAD